MFDLPQNAGDNAGYQLRITYKTDTRQFYVSGYVRFEGKGGIPEYERDGSVRVFDTMEDAIGSIIHYGE